MTWVVKNIWCYWGNKLFPSYVYTHITESRHISELTQIQNTSTFSFPIHLSLLSLSQRNVSSNAIGEKYSWTFLFEANKDFSQRESPGKEKHVHRPIECVLKGLCDNLLSVKKNKNKKWKLGVETKKKYIPWRLYYPIVQLKGKYRGNLCYKCLSRCNNMCTRSYNT